MKFILTLEKSELTEFISLVNKAKNVSLAKKLKIAVLKSKMKSLKKGETVTI